MKTSHEIVGAEMCVALQHPKLFVSRDAAALDHVQSAFKETADALVAQVVKA